jgi:hypothetical protein
MRKPNKHVFVRPLDNINHPKDGQMFLDWAAENPVNEFDPEVAKFKSSYTWCAYDKDGPLAYQTIQRPLMLESLAHRPGATKQQTAIALRELTQNAITQSQLLGAGEIYYLGSDTPTNDMATSQVFEELPYKVYRLKIKELEG